MGACERCRTYSAVRGGYCSFCLPKPRKPAGPFLRFALFVGGDFARDHEAAMVAEAGSMRAHLREEPGCSYCGEIRAARAAVRRAERGSVRAALALFVAFVLPFLGTLLAQYGHAVGVR